MRSTLESAALRPAGVETRAERFFSPSLRALHRRVLAVPFGERVLAGVFWSVAGTAFARALGVLASIVAARLLGRVSFGELGMIQGTVGMFGMVAGLGLGTTATKYVAEYRSTDPARAGRIVALASVFSWVTSGLMTVVLVVCAPWMSAHWLNAPHLAAPLQTGALLLLFGGVNGAQTGALAGLEAFRQIAKISFWTGLLSFPLLTAGVYFGSLAGAIWALVLNLAANCLLNYLALRRAMRRDRIAPDLHGLFGELPVVWRFSLPVTLVSLIVAPASWAGSVFLAQSTAGYAGLGEFSAGNQWRNVVMFIPYALAGVAMPTLSNLHGLHDPANYRKLLLLHLLLTTAFAGTAAAGVALFAGPIASSYGSNFAGAVPVIRWMALSGALIAVNSIAATAISSLGRAWTGCLYCLLCSSLLVLLSYALVPVHGARGLALANALAYAAHTVWQGAFLYRVLTGKTARMEAQPCAG